jgi:hypothetical protein
MADVGALSGWFCHPFKLDWHFQENSIRLSNQTPQQRSF